MGTKRPKKYLIIYGIITAGALLINGYLYSGALNCPNPGQYQSLCGSGFILALGVSIIFWIPYTARTLVYFIAEKMGKTNPSRFASYALFLSVIAIIIFVFLRLH